MVQRTTTETAITQRGPSIHLARAGGHVCVEKKQIHYFSVAIFARSIVYVQLDAAELGVCAPVRAGASVGPDSVACVRVA